MDSYCAASEGFTHNNNVKYLNPILVGENKITPPPSAYIEKKKNWSDAFTGQELHSSRNPIKNMKIRKY